MPKVYAIDGIVPVVDPSAFVHPTAILHGCVVRRGAHSRIDIPGTIPLSELKRKHEL
jgi:hypothetical protein